MLTKKDLLLTGIELPKEQDEVQMALPPSKGVTKEKKRKHHLFSPAIFKESLKSNKLALLICSLGNAIINIAIICILSTLNINATKEAMSSMFKNADYESTLKFSSVSMYTCYQKGAESYELINGSLEKARGETEQALSIVEDETLTNSISSAKKAYDLFYTLSTGTEEEKNTKAKERTMVLVNTLLDNSDYSEQEKQVAKSVISYYFDEYANDKSQSIKEILIKVLPLTIVDQVKEEMTLSKEQEASVISTYQDAFTKVYVEERNLGEVSVETSFSLAKVLASNEEAELLSPFLTSLENTYTKDKTAYLNDPTIQHNVIIQELETLVIETMEDIAYYQYLPTFVVNVKTSDRGYPIHYVKTGSYTESGQEIMKEEEILTYQPDLYLAVKGDMGTNATLLEKMHKDIITGVSYSEEEIQTAKEEAKEAIQTLKDHLHTFLVDFSTRDEEGKNSLFTGTVVNEVGVQQYLTKSIQEMAKVELVNDYNEKHEDKITSIEEITKENNDYSGEEMMNLVENYVASGITSFKTYQIQCERKGYSKEDVLLVSLVKASQGVIDSLPNKTGETLSELGSMNMYGFLIGIIGFALACLLVPMVYTILLANNLVANKVETGSLAFTLSTPIRRGTYIFTEAMYLLFTQVVMSLSLLIFSCLAQVIGVALGGTDLIVSLPLQDIMLYSFGNFMVMLAISGICFLSSCFFNKSNLAIAIGGGISIFFFICSILGLFGCQAMPGTIRIEQMNIFNNITILSLFDPLAVMNKDYTTFFVKLLGLLVIAGGTYTLGAIRFNKKDLPL